MLRSTSLGVSDRGGERGGRGGREKEREERGGGREEEREEGEKNGENVNMCPLFYVILFNHVLGVLVARCW